MSVELHPRATAGVYAEVINQIYDSLDKRIREAVSNAIDAKATTTRIEVFRQASNKPDKIVLWDNGQGMDTDDLQSKYICLGGGDNYNDRDSIGRIGIGALSVFALGDLITINTRKKGSDKIITAVLNFSHIKAADQHSKPLEEVKLGEITGERTAVESDSPNFTEIVVEDLSKEAQTTFADEERVKELIETMERVLPLSYRDDDPLFQHVSSELKNAICDDNRYIIEVILHIPHLDIRNMELHRRTAYSVSEVQIEEIIPLYPYGNFEGSADRNLRLYGYMYINKGRQLPKAWQGINTRIKNVTIEKNSFFGHEEDAAARVRIGGEVFIDNIDENRAIQSNRSGFAVENTDYRLVARYMVDWIKIAIARVRKSSEIDSLVKRIVRQLEKSYEMCGRVSNIEDAKEAAEQFRDLTDQNVEVGQIQKFSIEDKLIHGLRHINVAAEVVWAPTIQTSYHVERQDDDFYTVMIKQQYRDFTFDVGGNTIEYVLGRCGEEAPLVIKKGRTIFLNLENAALGAGEITRLDIGFLQVVLILYLNYLRCQGDARELYEAAIRDLSS